MKFVCLMYHQIELPHKNKFYVAPEEFRMQMEYIKNKGLKAIDLNNSLDGDVLITFDDGHKSNLEAARILANLGLHGVFYLVKDLSLSKEEYLSEKDIKEISDLGHTIGVHGKVHNWWTEKPPQQLIQELNETAKWIEGITGKQVITCSPPGGRINRREFKIIKENLPYFKHIRDSVCSYAKRTDKMIHSMPVTIDMNMNEFQKVININRMYYAQRIFIYHIKELVKSIIYRFRK